jgi:hypothetical protein
VQNERKYKNQHSKIHRLGTDHYESTFPKAMGFFWGKDGHFWGKDIVWRKKGSILVKDIW